MSPPKGDRLYKVVISFVLKADSPEEAKARAHFACQMMGPFAVSTAAIGQPQVGCLIAEVPAKP